MLSARTVIILVAVLCVLSLLGSVATMLRPPDQHGLGADSYGTRAYGYRALYETLAALGAAEERGLQPPGGLLDRSATLILWAPTGDLVANEPVYLKRVAQWIREGGRVVVALAAEDASPFHDRSNSWLKEKKTLELLGLPEVGTRRVDLSAPEKIQEEDETAEVADGEKEGEKDRAAAAGDEAPDEEAMPAEVEEEQNQDEPLPPTRRWVIEKHRRKVRQATIEGGLRTLLLPELGPLLEVDARGEGELASVASQVGRLSVPQEMQTLRIGESEPAGTILVVVDDKQLAVAAQYKLGAGELVVISDPAIFDNRQISKADNSVLAVRLFGARGGPIVWDEFYHGLTIRGSILFLLTRRSYAIVAVMILLITAAWLWRQSRYLGPPLSMVPISRRTVREYVEAMARFFKRGGESRRFMLDEVRRGVLWSLRRKTGAGRQQDAWSAHNSHPQAIDPKTGAADTGQRPSGAVQRPTSGDAESLEAIIAVLARHDPAAGRQLRDAVAQANQLLARPQKVGDRDILQAVKGLADCL